MMQKYSFLLITELALVFSSLLGFILRVQGLDLGTFLLIGGLGGLSALYIVQFVFPLKDQIGSPPKAGNLLTILIFILQSSLSLALLFKLSLWPYANDFLKYSILLAFGSMLMLLFQYRLAMEADLILHYRHLLRRALIGLSTGFLFFLTPYQKIAKLYYPKQPDYVEVIQEYLQNPADEKAKARYLKVSEENKK